MELKLGAVKLPSKYLTSLTSHKEQIWSNCFKLHYRVFRAPKHQFSFILQTDGIGVSLLFEHKHSDNGNGKRQKKCMDCVSEQRTEHSHYVHDLNKAQLSYLSTKTVVGVDPGKYNLVYMADGSFTKPTPKSKKKFRTLRYTVWQHHEEIKQKHYDRISKQLRDNNPAVAATERILATCSSRSVNVDIYKKYIFMQYYSITASEMCYHNEVFRKNRFRRYVLQQQSNAQLLNRVEKTFGKPSNIVLAYGDWSPCMSMKHFVPTKGEGLRKLLATRFQVVLVDEFRTSKLCSKPDCHNILSYHRNDCGKKVFRCLTCQECSARLPNTQRSAFMTRDLNSAINIRSLALQWIHCQNRPIAFRRGGIGCPVE